MIVLNGSDYIYAQLGATVAFSSFAAVGDSLSLGEINGPDRPMLNAVIASSAGGTIWNIADMDDPPGAGAMRMVHTVSIGQTGSGAATACSVWLSRGESTAVLLASATLSPGDLLAYESGRGWYTLKAGAVLTKAAP